MEKAGGISLAATMATLVSITWCRVFLILSGLNLGKNCDRGRLREDCESRCSVCRTGRELCYFRWKGGREEDIGAISYEPLLNEKYQARYETLEILLFSIQIP